MAARQASCVAIGDRALLIEGPSGSGKSILALALIDRGALLIGDDGVILHTRDGTLFAGPHPNTRGLLEVRNLGLLQFPVCEEAAVALVLRLDEAAPRFIEAAESCNVDGITLPMLRLQPGNPVLAIKAELALDRYGLRP
jgi:serine kinase of HPr protein (carbohydrate metabolism regulator)